MRSIIVENGEITESEFILEIDEKGIGVATYNKIKSSFRENSLKGGIHYDSKLKIYYVGKRQDVLDSLTIKEKENLL
jgi:hypothetical protein